MPEASTVQNSGYRRLFYSTFVDIVCPFVKLLQTQSHCYIPNLTVYISYVILN